MLQTLKPSLKFFLHLRRVLSLTLVQEIVFAIALQHSENAELRALALEEVKKQLPDLINNYIQSADSTGNKQQEDGLHDSSPEVLHLILIETLKDQNSYGLSSETKEKFLKNLKRDFPRELVPVVLAPLLYPGDGEITHVPNELDMATNQMVSHFYLLFIIYIYIIIFIAYIFFFF